VKETSFKLMEYISQKKTFKYRFDFEVGYLIKSPCKECDVRKYFPECADDCGTLDKIHTILSEVVSCTRNYWSIEPCI